MYVTDSPMVHSANSKIKLNIPLQYLFAHDTILTMVNFY